MMSDLSERMEKTLDSARSQLATVRTGRANPDILSKIMIDYYGSMVPISQMASVSVPESMMLQVSVYDANAVKSVEKAILMSDLNLNPQVEGNVMRIRLPELTEDRRKDLVRVVRKYIEDYKVAIRNIRRDEIDVIKAQEKDKEISSDESKQEQDSIQKITNQFVAELDQLSAQKEKEILSF